MLIYLYGISIFRTEKYIYIYIYVCVCVCVCVYISKQHSLSPSRRSKSVKELMSKADHKVNVPRWGPSRRFRYLTLTSLMSQLCLSMLQHVRRILVRIFQGSLNIANLRTAKRKSPITIDG